MVLDGDVGGGRVERRQEVDVVDVAEKDIVVVVVWGDGKALSVVRMVAASLLHAEGVVLSTAIHLTAVVVEVAALIGGGSDRSTTPPRLTLHYRPESRLVRPPLVLRARRD
jgi:hypothetical protein